eukprot:1159086-Pelagomonas_calceolata.AAC.6
MPAAADSHHLMWSAEILNPKNAAAAAAAAQIQALTAQLMSVSDFQQHQAEVEAEVMRLKEENQGLREKMESQRVDLERCVGLLRVPWR